ncbi:MAG: hypothetical protein JO256_07115 [Alphaproteobacteria bacterium]|nr:hypothetical protein [Alphaproteobacteria bacterium]
MPGPFAFAWGKLYLATVELSTGSEVLPIRVRQAYRHLGALNAQNLPAAGFERLKAIRRQFARSNSSADEEDATITLAALSDAEAALVAQEIVGLYDEVSRQRV